MPDDTFRELRSPGLVLRRLAPADAPAIYRYRSLPGVARYQSWESFTPADAERLVAGQAGLHPDVPGTWFQMAITSAGAGELIGDVGLNCRADDPTQVEIGITLDPAFQGHGYAAEAVRASLEYVFGRLGKHRVTATTDAENGRAAALFERLGFRREGHFLKNVWIKCRWGDEFQFAMLREDWEKRDG
jgi:RimJ/RimL family protein N-acetyltransferase